VGSNVHGDVPTVRRRPPSSKRPSNVVEFHSRHHPNSNDLDDIIVYITSLLAAIKIWQKSTYCYFFFSDSLLHGQDLEHLQSLVVHFGTHSIMLRKKRNKVRLLFIFSSPEEAK
jgi:hypothetical protein